MSVLCKFFGHKPQEGVGSGAEYMRWGNWGAVDGIGRHHHSLEARCARCNEWYSAGKVHMPPEQENGQQAIAYLHAILNQRRTAAEMLRVESAAREFLRNLGNDAPT